MNVLSITNMYPCRNSQKGIFVKEINDGLEDLNVKVSVLNVDDFGNTPFKYLRPIPKLVKMLSNITPNVIHVHFGLTFLSLIPLLPVLKIKKIKIIVFFHGSDVLGDSKFVRSVSYLAAICSNISIAVSEEIKSKLTGRLTNNRVNITVLPCGVRNEFFEIDNNPVNFNIIFPSSPSRKEKNYEFFVNTFNEIKKVYPEANLVVFENLDRKQVKDFLASSKLMLLTSDREGSPQVFKEAMAAGLPVLSRNVGDVLETSKFSPNAHVARDRDFIEAALKILKSKSNKNFDKKSLFENLSSKSICKKIRDISNEC